VTNKPLSDGTKKVNMKEKKGKRNNFLNMHTFKIHIFSDDVKIDDE
jgi:hypothetical protein